MRSNIVSNAEGRRLYNAQTEARSRTSTNKYHAEPVTVEGTRHDSKHEGRWAQKLRQLEAESLIRDLRLEKMDLRFALDVDGTRVAEYEADARFTVNGKPLEFTTLDGTVTLQPNQDCILDAKSPATRKAAAFPIKKRLMWALHKQKILEV